MESPWSWTSLPTLASRAWMQALVQSAGCGHQLHHLDVPDAVCKTRLRQRNAGGQHEFTVSENDFDLISSYFVPPSPDEGFDVIVHRP
jgi:predicted kinase